MEARVYGREGMDPGLRRYRKRKGIGPGHVRAGRVQL